MCFVKCGDLFSDKGILARDEIEMLSGNKTYIDYRIRKLIKKNFIGIKKYKYLKGILDTDKDILDELNKQAILAGLGKEFDLLINSGKEKVNGLLEL